MNQLPAILDLWRKEHAPTPVHQEQTRQGTDHITQDHPPEWLLQTEDVHTNADCPPAIESLPLPGPRLTVTQHQPIARLTKQP